MKKPVVYWLILLFSLTTIVSTSSCSRGYGCNNETAEARANRKSKPNKRSTGQLFDRRTRRQMNNQK